MAMERKIKCNIHSELNNKYSMGMGCWWLLSWLGKGVNTLKPRQNRHHFPDDIFKCIFYNENLWISIRISLKFVPKVPIDNKPALVQIMAWRQTGDKPLSEPMMAYFTDVFMRHMALMSRLTDINQQDWWNLDLLYREIWVNSFYAD